MPTITVLGGAGAVGRVAARTLALTGPFDRVVVADYDLASAKAVAADIGDKASAVFVDAGSIESVRGVVRGSSVVLNCTGPFYKYAKPVLQAVVAERLHYVDVCDDVDATLALLAMHDEVKAAGLTAVIGMGNSPGVTNLLGRFAYDQLLDETHAIDIYHAHGGEAFEGAGVVAHRLHGMGMDIPMYLEGRLQYVKFFEAGGLALRTTVDLPKIGPAVPVFPYPHPEQITMPRHLNVRQVTNRGTVLPDEYFQLTVEVARLGLTSQEPLKVGEQSVVPRDVAIAFLLKRRDEILKQLDFGSQRGCMLVEARGLRHGLPRAYRFSMASTDQALGEGTGIPAAMGAMLLEQGAISAQGVLPPEAAINPIDFLALVPQVLATRAGKGSFEGVVVEKIDEHGAREIIPLPI